MTDRTATPVADVHVILRDGDKILLAQRGGPYGYGQWHAPSGKLDQDESLLAAAVREAYEETGVRIDPGHLRLAHTVHHRQGADAPDRIGFFFETNVWEGDPENREPDKCLAIAWFAVHELPDELIPYPAAGIHGCLTDEGGLTIHGW